MAITNRSLLLCFRVRANVIFFIKLHQVEFILYHFYHTHNTSQSSVSGGGALLHTVNQGSSLQMMVWATMCWHLGFHGGSKNKESTCNAGDEGLIPGSGRSPGGGHGNPLQYSCLENPMDRGAWRAAVHGVTKSQTRLKRLSTHARTSLWPADE